MNRDGWYMGAAEVRGLRLLAEATGGTFEFWHLSGPRMAKVRQAIASAMEGKPVPQSKCGVNRLREVFHACARMNAPQHFEHVQCIANADRAFADYAGAVLASGVRA